jgi:hypothetical protein
MLFRCVVLLKQTGNFCVATFEGSALYALAVQSDVHTMEMASEGLYHRERILETSTLSCNKEEEEITKPPKR